MESVTMTGAESRLRVRISRQDKSVDSFADDVLEGLSSNPKTLPPKYFYDQTGSKLFEQICELPEYYPTRTEKAILTDYADEITYCFDDDMILVELGSGAAVKTRFLIEAFLRRQTDLQYLPIDISKSALVESSHALLKDYPALRITGYVSDYHTALTSLRNNELGPKLLIFLGSNIGNFEKQAADHFLKEVCAAMSDRDRLLIGVDLAKDRTIIEPAYNDGQGVTAQFNQNLLVRINRELGGNFDLDRFKHLAFLNTEMGRIEMHLESTEKQTVNVDSLERRFFFGQGETIHTESSYKYSPDEIKALALRNGLVVQQSWFDENRWFSLNLLKPIDD